MSSEDNMVGLSSRDALKKLHTVIQGELRSYQKEKNWKLEGVPSHCGDLSYHPYSTLHWTNVSILFLFAALMLISYGILNSASNYQLVVEAVIILILLVIHIYINYSDDRLRKKEMQYQAEQLLRKLQGCITSCATWDVKLYPDLSTPQSRSISLQWTFRDNCLVNLPCNLLVSGDTIALRPGQLVPVRVREAKPSDGNVSVELEVGEMYNPCPEDAMEEIEEAVAHEPMKATQFIVLETPYAETLRKCLWNSMNRPLTLLQNKQIVCSTLIERRILPIVFLLSLFANILRYVKLPDDMGHWSTMIILLPIYTSLPLLPLVVPTLWIVINSYGVARILACFEKSKHSVKAQVLEAMETLDEQETLIKQNISFKTVWQHFSPVLFGKSTTLARTANIMQTLGTMTELCCVDKTGVLSWPNPSVEKVFFISSEPTEDDDEEEEVDEDFLNEQEEEKMGEVKSNHALDNDSVFESGKQPQEEDYFAECHVEVLDLTENPMTEDGLQFDDSRWERHLNSLKPLGLNILVNTCNMEAMPERTKFIDHIACIASLQNLPLITRRCLCELAHLIGFSEQAYGDRFKLQQQLASYRKMPIDSMPNQSGVSSVRKSNHIIRSTHYLICIQMLTEGTAGMVLDACTDFWDGTDLCPLTDTDRKKILDFYHRASLSAYCCAFAYRPLPAIISSDLCDSYIEMPTTEANVHATHDTASPTKSPGHNSLRANGKRYRSSGSVHMSNIEDPDGVFRAQCGQIFIGMVAMQYQAKRDIVSLIENLDNACIRFVHFSPDNEMKSKVFAEKVGLEVGWNCHISLRSSEMPPANHVATQLGYTTPTNKKTSQQSLIRKKNVEGDVLVDVENLQVKWKDEEKMNKTLLPPISVRRKLQTTKSLDNVSEHEDAVKTLIHSRSCGNVPICTSEEFVESTPMTADANPAKDISFRDSSRMQKTGSCNPDESLRLRHVSETCTYSTIASEEYEIDGLLSNLTDSAFDMTNRAKLPRGIENIRPHIENVDNVPLLVPLFTNSTPDATKEMITVMQEYGEVVCCIGSTVNVYNTAIFLQADLGIGIEPLYPQVCKQHRDEEFLRHCNSSTNNTEGLLPLDLSHMLAGLPCSLSFHREDNISIIEMIKEARSFTHAIINCFIFLMYCQIAISVIQLVACFLLLPPPLTGNHVLWMSCVIVPLVSITFFATPTDRKIMRLAPSKNLKHWDMQVIGQHTLYFIFKFFFSILVCVLIFAMCLNNLCVDMTGSQQECHILLGDRNNTESWNGWNSEHSQGLLLTQNIVAFFMVLYIAFTSICYVHPLKSLWRQHPFNNGLWCIMIPVVLVLQIMYFCFDMIIWDSTQLHYEFSLLDAPLEAWLLGILWPLLLIPICEIVKLYEVRLHVRYQKRAKLQFGTKLGMNSPF
uniref:Uncharacterized protein KIAA0195-like n=1 Tax=Saccoglossus kowalevskii TaxID=10224 RepID=A0ABM0M8K2_SACKO|nr:PREDICTED: uncharacterized protein KIAA0195-like [Saccoglossus kowalevskii]